MNKPLFFRSLAILDQSTLLKERPIGPKSTELRVSNLKLMPVKTDSGKKTDLMDKFHEKRGLGDTKRDLTEKRVFEKTMDFEDNQEIILPIRSAVSMKISPQQIIPRSKTPDIPKLIIPARAAKKQQLFEKTEMIEEYEKIKRSDLPFDRTRIFRTPTKVSTCEKVESS